MPNFLHRSYQKELLDRDDIPFADIEQNMRELNTINHRLGGHAITLKGVQHFCKKIIREPLRIMEIGCGGGDNLRVIHRWAKSKKIEVALTGVDINKACVQFAKGLQENRDILFIQSDYREIKLEQQPHLIFSSLFCHHFQNEELIFQLKWMNENSQKGFFINDLQRHPIAYYSIKGLTRLLSKSYLVKNDAPLSVLRGFSREEWKNLVESAGIRNIKIKWCWAFRWLLICDKS